MTDLIKCHSGNVHLCSVQRGPGKSCLMLHLVYEKMLLKEDSNTLLEFESEDHGNDRDPPRIHTGLQITQDMVLGVLLEDTVAKTPSWSMVMHLVSAGNGHIVYL